MKPKILWISLCAPYDKVGHGGGKTHNFYLKKLLEKNFFDIELISFCDLEEYEIVKSDLKKYSVKNTIIPWTHNLSIRNLKRKFQLLDCQYNIFNKYGGATNNYYWDNIKRILLSLNYTPDVIILQWTEIVLFLEKIKKIFPSSKIIAIEEDVKFLSYKRKSDICNHFFKKLFLTKKYNCLKKYELSSISKADLVITYSDKDKNLIYNNQKEILVLSPFFEKYKCIRNNNDDVFSFLFYGAMSRQDNYDSAIWFIENVFKKLPIQNKKFYIVGNKPVPKLLKYASKNIIITGFVDTPLPYFEKCTCLVAPLISGAGIKIKVLEALSAGIPVLTNEIGIEGINARPGIDYIFCKTSFDYLKTIMQLEPNQINSLSKNSQEFINKNYNLFSDLDKLTSRILDLIK